MYYSTSSNNQEKKKNKVNKLGYPEIISFLVDYYNRWGLKNIRSISTN